MGDRRERFDRRRAEQFATRHRNARRKVKERARRAVRLAARAAKLAQAKA